MSSPEPLEIARQICSDFRDHIRHAFVSGRFDGEVIEGSGQPVSDDAEGVNVSSNQLRKERGADGFQRRITYLA